MTYRPIWETQMNRNRLIYVVGAVALLIVLSVTTRLALAVREVTANEQRANEAEAGRWTGLAHLYAMRAAAENQQRANEAEAARWTGLALQEYERTGDHKNLPQCIPARVWAQLPMFNDNLWRSLVPTCGQ